jgi:hypothetical protein
MTWQHENELPEEQVANRLDCALRKALTAPQGLLSRR